MFFGSSLEYELFWYEVLELIIDDFTSFCLCFSLSSLSICFSNNDFFDSILFIFWSISSIKTNNFGSSKKLFKFFLTFVDQKSKRLITPWLSLLNSKAFNIKSSWSYTIFFNCEKCYFIKKDFFKQI